MRKCWSVAVLLLVLPLLASEAGAVVGTWDTNPLLGPSQVVYTLDLHCSGGSLVCGVLDDYVDVQADPIDASGEADVGGSGILSFVQDGTFDPGSGPQPVGLRLPLDPIAFAEIPFIGAPQTQSGLVVVLGAFDLDTGGPLAEGEYPVSITVPMAAYADIVGPVDAYVPEILIGPNDVDLTGTLEVVFVGGKVSWRLRDLTGTLQIQNPTVLLDENVIVDVTADLTLNLAGSTFGPTEVPTLGGTGGLALVGALLVTGLLARRHAVRGTG